MKFKKNKKMKIDTEEIESVLLKEKIEPEKVQKIIKELIEIKKEQKAHDQKITPKSKREYGIVVSDTENVLNGKELTGWVYQLNQGDDHGLVLTKLSTAIKNQNESSKRKKTLITTIGESFQFLKRKFTKEQNVLIKTKIPVRVVITNNKLINILH